MIILGIFFGGTGIVQLIEKRYVAFARLVIAWVIMLIVFIIAASIIGGNPELFENDLDFSNPTVKQLVALALVAFADWVYIFIYHIGTMIYVIKEYSNRTT